MAIKIGAANMGETIYWSNSSHALKIVDLPRANSTAAMQQETAATCLSR